MINLMTRSNMNTGEGWEDLNKRAEEIADRTTRVKRKHLPPTKDTRTNGCADTGVDWNRLIECPFIPAGGSYEDFKILAETFETDTKALIDMHRLI